jgi:hypothetical protein
MTTGANQVMIMMMVDGYSGSDLLSTHDHHSCQPVVIIVLHDSHHRMIFLSHDPPDDTPSDGAP